MKKLIVTILLFIGLTMAQEVPKNWQINSSALTIEKDSTTVFEGKYSAKATWTSTSNQDFDSDPITVEAGTFYARFKVQDNDPAGRARIALIWEGASNSYGSYSQDNTDWQTLVLQGTVPDGATSVQLRVRFYDVSSDWDGDATVFVDSLFLSFNSGQNKVLNPGLELWTGQAAVQHYSIQEIQQTVDGQEGDSPLKDQVVETSGIVTAVSGSSSYIQDGTGAWSGINVYDGTFSGSVAVGDMVTITGKVVEYNNKTEITSITQFEVNSSGNQLPEPTILMTSEIAQEKYEGVLVKVNNVTCTDPDLGFGEWEVDDQSGPARVDDLIFAYTPSLNQNFTSITGIVEYTYSNFKIEPRSMEDIIVESSLPIIHSVNSEVKTPLADEDFTITVIASDEQGIDSVSIDYLINQKVAGHVKLSGTDNDSTFTGAISEVEYENGDVIEWWVVVTDSTGNKSISDTTGFFAGISSIESLSQVDENGVLVYESYFARTTGTATVSDSTFSTTSLQVYIQDETSGINIYKKDLGSINFIEGNSYTVVGELQQYYGLSELVPDDVNTDIIDNGAVDMPAPIDVTISVLLASPEAFEGLLVRIANADTVAGAGTWPMDGENMNMTITDDGGTSQLTLRVDRDTNIDGSDEPTYPITVTGVISQYDRSSPYSDGYQIMPRTRNDIESSTAIGNDDFAQPRSFTLYAAYPNPFNPSTTIAFDVPAELAGQTVQLTIYNVLGQKVATLVDQNLTAGRHIAKWNGRNDLSQAMPSGVYFAILKAAGQQKTSRLLLIK